MTDKEIVEKAKDAEKRTGFGKLVHSTISKGVNSAYGIGFIEGMVEYRNSMQENHVSSVWHDKSEEPDEDRQVLVNLSGYCFVDFYHKEDKRFYMFCKPKHYLCEIDKWAYIDDLISASVAKKEPLSDDLDDAARNYGDELDNVLSVGVDDDNSIGEYAQEAFKAGAKWQKEQFEKNYTNLCNGIATVKGLAVSMAYDKGVADTKEQLMKNAIDTEVKVDAGGYPYVDRTIELYDYDRDIPLAKLGDKVKVIVIKDE